MSASLDQSLLPSGSDRPAPRVPRLWDLEAMEVMEELVDHASPTVAMEVDWVGRQALCLSADGALRLWALQGSVEQRRAEAERLGATRPRKGGETTEDDWETS